MVPWDDYDPSWFTAELGAVALMITANGGTLHAVVVCINDGGDEPLYLDFSPCTSTEHGVPPTPPYLELSFLVLETDGVVHVRNRSSGAVTIGEA